MPTAVLFVRDLETLFQQKLGPGKLDLTSPNAELLQISWDFGLSGVQLTSVGKLLGGFVFDNLLGSKLAVPSWD